VLKKTITYDSPFTNDAVTEDHYFHISKADLLEMEMEEHNNEYKKDGQTLTGMQAKLQRIIDAQDGKAIINELKEIILRAYGKKEGDRFVKSRAIREEFEASEAFSEMLFELATNAEAASEFINKVVPGNLEQVAAEVRAQAAREELSNGTAAKSETPSVGISERQKALEAATPENPVEIKQSDIVSGEISSDKLTSGIADGRYTLGPPTGHTAV